MQISQDVILERKVGIHSGGTTLLIAEGTSNNLRLRFEGPAQQMVDILDQLAAGALEIRGRLLREVATDEDA